MMGMAKNVLLMTMTGFLTLVAIAYNCSVEEIRLNRLATQTCISRCISKGKEYNFKRVIRVDDKVVFCSCE